METGSGRRRDRGRGLQHIGESGRRRPTDPEHAQAADRLAPGECPSSMIIGNLFGELTPPFHHKNLPVDTNCPKWILWSAMPSIHPIRFCGSAGCGWRSTG
ncbi:hypothetical protein Areg01_41220 [Actinoplanes regularis]|nr:hypothetical protein Areg01_41220 [Actinoplanes regularis]